MNEIRPTLLLKVRIFLLSQPVASPLFKVHFDTSLPANLFCSVNKSIKGKPGKQVVGPKLVVFHDSLKVIKLETNALGQKAVWAQIRKSNPKATHLMTFALQF